MDFDDVRPDRKRQRDSPKLRKKIILCRHVR